MGGGGFHLGCSPVGLTVMVLLVIHYPPVVSVMSVFKKPQQVSLCTVACNVFGLQKIIYGKIDY